MISICNHNRQIIMQENIKTIHLFAIGLGVVLKNEVIVDLI